MVSEKRKILYVRNRLSCGLLYNPVQPDFTFFKQNPNLYFVLK